MTKNKIDYLKEKLQKVRESAVSARISGENSRAECLVGKAIGLHQTLSLAEDVLSGKAASAATGELEGIEEAINMLKPLPRC